MNPVTPLSIIQAQFGTALTPGTATAVGIDFSPGYEPDFSYVASCGAVTAGGTATAHLQGSDVLGSGYTSIGTVTFVDAAGGTTVKVIDADARTATNRYFRSLITVVGGTASVSSVIVAKPRTVT